MNRFDCPLCSFPLKYDDTNAGRKARCPRCGMPMRLPGGPKDAAAPNQGTDPKAPPAPKAVSGRAQAGTLPRAGSRRPTSHQGQSHFLRTMAGVFGTFFQAVCAPFRRR
jgi:hypothetical protein